MKRFLILLCTVALIFGMTGMASATLFQERYSGSHGLSQGDSLNFGFDFLNENILSGIGTDSALGLDVDAEGMKPYYTWNSALLKVKLYSKDEPTETLGFDLQVLDIGGGLVYDIGRVDTVEFDLHAENKYATYTYELTPEQLAAYNLNSSSWSNLKISAVADDFTIKRVGMDVNASPSPEPATLLLMGSGLLGAAGIGRKRIKKS